MMVYRAERDGRIYSNPILVAEKGADFSANLVNGLDQDTTVHCHGLHLGVVSPVFP